MSSINLYIPAKIRVGFQQRNDTYTGKLGFVVYFKQDNTIFNEKRWKSWCDSKIQYVDFENKPGNFVLNKGVERNGYMSSGRSYIRVYDTRDFEFEISVDNLMSLLMHSDVSKRDVLEKCVFAWNGNRLLLVPINSNEYQQALKHTNKQKHEIKETDLKEGFLYSHKQNDNTYMYMGKLEEWNWEWVNQDFHNRNYSTDEYIQRKKKNTHLFYVNDQFVYEKPEKLSAELSTEKSETFNDIYLTVDSKVHSKPDKYYKLVDASLSSEYKFKEFNGILYGISDLSYSARPLKVCKFVMSTKQKRLYLTKTTLRDDFWKSNNPDEIVLVNELNDYNVGKKDYYDRKSDFLKICKEKGWTDLAFSHDNETFRLSNPFFR